MYTRVPKGNKCRLYTNIALNCRVFLLKVYMWKWKPFLIGKHHKIYTNETNRKRTAHMSLIYLCKKIYCWNSWVFQKEIYHNMRIIHFHAEVEHIWPQLCNLNTSPKILGACVGVSVAISFFPFFQLSVPHEAIEDT